MKGKLAQLPEEMASLSISFNYFTDVISFQKILESPLEKKVSCSQLFLYVLKASDFKVCSVCFLLELTRRQRYCTGNNIHALSNCTSCHNVQATTCLHAQAGINYGPPGTKQLIYFVDDLNMPKLDPYETAMPISLIRQHLGWGHWFDRAKLTQKNINNTQ